MKECQKNTDPMPDKKGKQTHPQNQVQYSGHKKDGEKSSSDGKGHYSGH